MINNALVPSVSPFIPFSPRAHTCIHTDTVGLVEHPLSSPVYSHLCFVLLPHEDAVLMPWHCFSTTSTPCHPTTASPAYLLFSIKYGSLICLFKIYLFLFMGFKQFHHACTHRGIWKELSRDTAQYQWNHFKSVCKQLSAFLSLPFLPLSCQSCPLLKPQQSSPRERKGWGRIRELYGKEVVQSLSLVVNDVCRSIISCRKILGLQIELCLSCTMKLMPFALCWGEHSTLCTSFSISQNGYSKKSSQ